MRAAARCGVRGGVEEAVRGRLRDGVDPKQAFLLTRVNPSDPARAAASGSGGRGQDSSLASATSLGKLLVGSSIEVYWPLDKAWCLCAHFCVGDSPEISAD